MATNIKDKTIKAYFRLTSKYAKIVHLQTNTSTDQLYLFASQNYNLPIEDIHLFYQGKLLPTSTMLSLEENAIIHIVRLHSLKRDTINISIKMIGNHNHVIQLEIQGNTIVRRFIEDKICTAFGVKLNQIFLVYLGKQLKLQNSFKKQQVQDGSEILCLFLQSNNTSQCIDHKIQEKDDQKYQIKLPIQKLQTPQPPKDIYPKLDFAINVPQGIETNNNLNLIFDSKVIRSSSIQNMELHPSEIIPQEESNFSADFVKCSHSYRQDYEVQSKKKESCFSQQWNIKSPRQSQIQKSSLLQLKLIDFKNNDIIYAANFHMLKDSNVMGDLISEYKEKLKMKIDKYEGKD